MKLGPLTKRASRQTQKIDDDVTSANCDAIAFFINRQFAAIRNPDSGHMAYKFTFTFSYAPVVTYQISSF